MSTAIAMLEENEPLSKIIRYIELGEKEIAVIAKEESLEVSKDESEQGQYSHCCC